MVAFKIAKCQAERSKVKFLRRGHPPYSAASSSEVQAAFRLALFRGLNSFPMPPTKALAGARAIHAAAPVRSSVVVLDEIAIGRDLHLVDGLEPGALVLDGPERDTGAHPKRREGRWSAAGRSASAPAATAPSATIPCPSFRLHSIGPAAHMAANGFGPGHRDARSAWEPNGITTCWNHSTLFGSGSEVFEGPLGWWR